MGKKLEAPPEHPNTRKLLGTFTAPSGLAIGEPYADRRIADPRHKGKGLEAGVWRGKDKRTEQCAPGTFSLQPFLFANFDAKGKDVYKESIKYLERYKSGDKRPKGAPKTGFMTSDFPKRDEYTNTIRTEQLREVLRREGRMETARRRTEDERMKTAGVRPRTAQPSGELKRVELYDLVFRMPPSNLHHHRDDRSGRPFYMGIRQKTNLRHLGSSLLGKASSFVPDGVQHVEEKPKIVDGHAWVSVTLPNGEYRQILVNEQRQVLAKRPMSAHI